MDAELRPWSIDQMDVRKHPGRRGEGVSVGIVDSGYAPHADLEHAVIRTKDFTGSRSGATDMHGHGTHVAGTVAGRETGEGGVGVAPFAHLAIAKALGDDGTGSDETTSEAITWLVGIGATIINMSLGSQVKMPRTSEAIRLATEAGVYVVVAAGNGGDNSRSWPALDERCVSVAAVDVNHRPADFSEPSSVDVACPGVKILSCYKNGQYAVLSGTSMAAPWFSGALAIFLSDLKHRGEPWPAPARLFDIIRAWTDDIGQAGDDIKTGLGMVSPKKYAASIKKPEPPAPVEAWTPTIRFTENWALCKRA